MSPFNLLLSDVWLAVAKLIPKSFEAFFSISKTIQGLLEHFKIHSRFKASLEFDAGTETLNTGTNEQRKIFL